MNRWLVTILTATLGRFFNNPNRIYQMEDKLANSAPIRQLARTIVALYQRGSWELERQMKSIAEKQGPSGQHPFSRVQDEMLRRSKHFEELRKILEKKK